MWKVKNIFGEEIIWYSEEEYKKLLEENENLKYEIDRHKETIYHLNNYDMCRKTLISYKQALEEILDAIAKIIARKGGASNEESLFWIKFMRY